MSNNLHKKYKLIFWDFDGVLLDSMPVRDEGFRDVLKDFPQEQVDNLISYHQQNGGLSRYHKFRYFYEKILGKTISDDEVNALAAKFSVIMREKLTNPVNLIHDALDYVKKYHSEVPMCIVSGSDGEELRYLCDKLGIAQYFKDIEGSPTPKPELIRRLLIKHDLQGPECCLIGDSRNDFEAAQDNKLDFYGYNCAESDEFVLIKTFA